MTRPKSLAATALAVLFLAACGSTGGGLGDILGGGGNQSSNYEIRGTVDHVDQNSRSIYLTNVSGMTSMLSNSGGTSGSSVRVYYDNQTTVSYQGQTHRPENLERGDEVTVRVSESTNNTLIADTMTVTHDSSGGTSPSSGAYGSMLRGTVTYVDSSRRTIELNRGVGSNVIVEYGANTPVYFNGQTYRPADLERGDEIEISVRDLGSNRFSANDITVVRSVSGNNSGSSSSSSRQTVRGTVSYVDVNRRTIELESASWISRFNSGTGNTGSRITISYDNNVSVDVNGRLHPVSGLERGDVVEVQVDNYNNTMRATRILLVRDVNDLR